MTFKDHCNSENKAETKVVKWYTSIHNDCRTYSTSQGFWAPLKKHQGLCQFLPTLISNSMFLKIFLRMEWITISQNLWFEMVNRRNNLSASATSNTLYQRPLEIQCKRNVLLKKVLLGKSRYILLDQQEVGIMSTDFCNSHPQMIHFLKKDRSISREIKELSQNLSSHRSIKRKSQKT